MKNPLPKYETITCLPEIESSSIMHRALLECRPSVTEVLPMVWQTPVSGPSVKQMRRYGIPVVMFSSIATTSNSVSPSLTRSPTCRRFENKRSGRATKVLEIILLLHGIVLNLKVKPTHVRVVGNNLIALVTSTPGTVSWMKHDLAAEILVALRTNNLAFALVLRHSMHEVSCFIFTRATSLMRPLWRRDAEDNDDTINRSFSSISRSPQFEVPVSPLAQIIKVHVKAETIGNPPQRRVLMIAAGQHKRAEPGCKRKHHQQPAKADK
ncbi:hypothetical protein CCR75_009183 [Bremia lactucae]|uniref:Uncharacterized protein n=1 Tax=Bremia lactucae TaxID=4779 RepID=A0A976IDG0_BRELC|nr:hypothetical protein CCR75_009183 [Bremia lactucae]